MYAETRPRPASPRCRRRCARRSARWSAIALVRRPGVAAAYRNHPLPIGAGQTISQPYIVALSADLLNPKAGDVVLEVGTGSGTRRQCWPRW